MEKLGKVNLDKSDKQNVWMKRQASFAGQKELCERLYSWVYSDIHPEEEE